MSILQIKYHPGLCYYQIALPVVMGTFPYFLFSSVGLAVMYWDLIMAAIFLYFLFRSFIPMVRGKIALELNETGIYDFIRNQSVSWEEVEGFRKISFIKNAQQFQIGVVLLQRKEFVRNKSIGRKLIYWPLMFIYRTPFVISLRLLAGSNEEIWENVLSYYNQIKVCS